MASSGKEIVRFIEAALHIFPPQEKVLVNGIHPVAMTSAVAAVIKINYGTILSGTFLISSARTTSAFPAKGGGVERN